MLVGNTTAAARLVQMFDRGDTLPEQPLDVLCSGDASGGAASAAERVVCNCAKVTQSGIVAAIEAGAGTVEGVSKATGAATGCGSCKTEVAELVTRYGRRDPRALAE
jgi:nitrite reductase (NADH) large subunit